MMTSRSGKLTKGSLISGLGLIVLLCLIPVEVSVVPAWELQVLNIDRTPAEGIEVEQVWIDYDLGIDWQKDIRKTDKQGKVVFTPKTVKTALLQQAILVPIKRRLTIFSIHEGIGKHAGVSVKGFSQHLDYSEGDELKQELVLQTLLK